MDDEKKWPGDEPQQDTAPPEAPKPSVHYEEISTRSVVANNDIKISVYETIRRLKGDL